MPRAPIMGHHENTITVSGTDPNNVVWHFVIPTVVGGRQLTREQATEHFRKNKRSFLGRFKSRKEADAWAGKRSRESKE
jgi:hypothetical protein